jgi:hypothetical protein
MSTRAELRQTREQKNSHVSPHVTVWTPEDEWIVLCGQPVNAEHRPRGLLAWVLREHLAPARYGSDSAENGGADDIANLGDVTDDGEA